jgi:hypothetical protein
MYEEDEKKGGDSFRKNKGGQVTIFIIIAVLVMAAAVLIYMFYPKIETTEEFDTENPSAFIQTCLEKEIEESVNTLSLQGGSLDPDHYILYQGEKVEYLCYTEEYYARCVMQQPMLKSHIENEIKGNIENSVVACFNELQNSYSERGYGVNLKPGLTSVELLPKRVVTSFDYVLTVSKDGSETFDSFRVVLNNNLYELVSITNSILNWEARYGEAETTLYMNYYKDLKVEKKKQIDGTNIYILTDRNNENKFQFASRSVAWPPGFGIDGVST